MHRLQVRNFGPIIECEIDLNDFTILIGPQSSGKSTISKLFYFFLNIRDEFVKFLLDSNDNSMSSHTLIIIFEKTIRKRFIEFWGPTPQDSNLFVKYYYNSEIFLEIKLDSSKHKFIDPKLSKKLTDSLCSEYNNLQTKKINDESSSNLFSSASSISSERIKSDKVEKLIESSKNIFNFKEDLLFIPAGRSLLSTISDQLQNIHPHQLDYPMRTFIERINRSKSFFGKSINDLIKEKQLTGEEKVWFSATRKVEGIIKRILKGEFIHDKDGGKLYVNKNTYTKINFASSGQQESIWILLSLFLVVLEKINAVIFIEEPEAHLFPIAQKEMVELISFLSKTMNTKFVITTHSPYILAALNNHIYAFDLGANKSEKVSEVLPANTWVDYNKIAGYFVLDGRLMSLCDDSLRMLKTELIDSASDQVNAEYDILFKIDKEIEYEK